VEALSGSEVWSSGNMPTTLVYFWSWSLGSGFVPGLRPNWNVSINYNAQVINNRVPLIGTVVSVGDRITFSAVPFADTNISWFGTGRSEDSPFGHWLTGATAPSDAFASTDYVGRDDWSVYGGGNWGHWQYDVYIPLSVNPPTVTYDHVGSTAGLSCDASGQNCVVTSSGSIVGHVIFGNTYGKFYYMYYPIVAYNPVIYYNKVAMQEGALCYEAPFWRCFGGNAGSDYILPVASKTITFNLTAVSGNNNPTIPTVTPQPFNGNTNTGYPFTFTATDPDGDQIAYEVDWNNDSAVDQSTPFVSSGTSQSLSNPMAQWAAAGTYSFKVRTKDNKGGVSAWATPSATVVSAVTGVCGLASGFSFDTLLPTDPALCATGTPGSFLSIGTGWTWGCNGSGGGTSTASNACTATIKTYTLTAMKNLGLAAAGTIIDTTPTGTSIDSTVPRNSESVPYNASRTLRANPNSSSISWSGCTTVSGNDCTIANITSAKTVTATFTRLPEPGICGSSNGGSFEALNIGSSGLCSSGAVTGFSFSGTTYSWDCNGSFGSIINVSCSATQIRNYNWRETSP
jgi:hypothetical protein